MLSVSVFRNAAVMSAKRTTVKVGYSLAPRRLYTTTEGGDKKTEEQPKKEEEAAKVEVELSEEVKKMLAEKDKQIAEIKDAYLRSLADQENIRERSRKEIDTTREYAIQKFAKDLLDTVDILNMAITAVPAELREKSSTHEHTKDVTKVFDHLTNLYMGVSMTESELIKALKRHGVDRVNPEGEVFDPNKHEALFQAPMPDKTAGTIFNVTKMGYTLKGRVLRPAQVGVVADTQ